LSPEDIGMAGSGQADAYRSIGRECMLAEVDCVDEQGRPLPAGKVGEMVLSAPWLFSGY
jgi:non-ribosomal peptide synthetase component E (peptide arylation enzyme)